jgi:hypothetical protein
MMLTKSHSDIITTLLVLLRAFFIAQNQPLVQLFAERYSLIKKSFSPFSSLWFDLIMDLILKVIAVIFAFFGGRNTLGHLFALLAGTSHYPILEDLGLLFIFGLSPLGIAVGLWRLSGRVSYQALYNKLEPKALAIAKRNQGRVSAALLAKDAGIPVSQAQRVLEDMREKYALLPELDERNGQIWYDVSTLLA